MTKARNSSLWILLAIAIGLALIGMFFRYRHLKPLTITGAITVQDTDPRKQLPIAGVEVSFVNNSGEPSVKSDSSGFFSLKLRQGLRRGQPLTLMFRHPDYHPLDVKEFVANKLYVVHLVPLSTVANIDPSHPGTAVANIRVRYSINATSKINIGSAVKTFLVENVGNLPCKQRPPCSPDGKWKATLGSASLDAGMGNEFHNVRVSCIAGPCPFTQIDADDGPSARQKITASALNWSDPATFLVEAEVMHTMQTPIDHQSYPVIFGSTLNFTLPTDAEGVSVEADVAGKTIIFPLGPDLNLSWATCSARVNKEQTRVYRCNVKAGYRFQ